MAPAICLVQLSLQGVEMSEVSTVMEVVFLWQTPTPATAGQTQLGTEESFAFHGDASYLGGLCLRAACNWPRAGQGLCNGVWA